MLGCCFCFPDSQRVLTVKGYVRVCDLKPTDQLVVFSRSRKNKGVNVKTTPFYSFLHFDPNLVAKYVTIKCDSGAELVVSGGHVLFRSSNGILEDVAANEIRIGDCLVYLGSDNEIVTPTVIEIKPEVEIEGAYAPLSKNGTLIVEGFMASCYAELGHFSHAQAHASLAPLRLWFKTGSKFMPWKNGNIGKNSSKVQNGIPHYARFLMAVRNGFERK